MALLICYLDLGSSGTGHAGSENDPWSVSDWQSAVSTNQSYVIYTKGTIIDTTGTIDVAFDTSGTIVNYYLPWDPLINGPWRMNLSRQLATGASAFLRGGVFWLNNIDIAGGNYYFSTCYIKCKNFIRGSMKGCHLIASGNYQPVSLGTTINDSAIVALSYSTFVQHYNCISNTYSAPYPCTNYQAWPSPFYGHPTFDANKEAFRGLYYRYGSDAPYFVNYPPNPGTIPFEDFIPESPIEIPANYDQEIWGDNRVGIGISTDCVQYVDLQSHTITTGPTYPIGSPLNPLDWQQWQILICDYPILSYIFLMKNHGGGVLNVSSSSHKYLAWRPDLNGPWRASSVRDVTNCTISGAIIDSCTDPNNTTFLNCQVTFKQSVLSTGTVTMKGCLVSVEGDFNPSRAVLESCAFKVTGTIAASSIGTAVNCAFNKFSGNLVTTDCQINWVPPPFPEYSQGYEAFSNGLLYDGVTTPPQPGLIPYTGYETDLWGAPRQTIGTGYTMSMSSVGWVDSYPKISNITAVGATFKVATDVNSTVSFVIVPRGAASPSIEQILAGKDSNGITLGIGFSGNTTSGPIESTLTASNLVTNVDYDAYFVADKYTHDVQSSIVKLDLRPTGEKYYIDLNADSNMRTGTINNPFSIEEWQSKLSTVGNNAIFYIKGSIIYYQQVNFLSLQNPVQGLVYRAWDPIQNGPWRIYTNSVFFASNVTIADGIIQSNGMLSNQNTKIFNMYLIFAQELQHFATETIKGSSIKANKIYLHSEFTPVDCGFKVSELQGNAENFINCALDYVTDNSADTTFTNCSMVSFKATQKKYDNTVFIPNGGLTTEWPVWDAEETAFLVTNMYPNVPIPPQPGVPPYTDYELDLWGKPRSGIGVNSGSGGVIFPPVWMDLLPYLHSSDSETGMFLVGLRTQGTCYAVAVPFDSEAPTTEQVKAGENAKGHSTINSHIDVQANVASVLTITGLKENKNYDIYFVAESEIIQNSTVKIFYKASFIEGHTFEGIVIAGKNNNKSILPKIQTLFSNINMPDMKDKKPK